MKKIVSWVILIICLYFLFRKVDFKIVKNIFFQANWFLVFIYFFLGFFIFFIKVYRWKVILSYVKDIRFVTLFEILGFAQLISFVFPFRVGDIIQIFSLSARENISKTIVLASIIWYQLLDIILILVVSFYVSGYITMSKFLFLRKYIFLILFFLILFLIFYRKIFEFLKLKIKVLNDKIELIQVALREFTSFFSLLKAAFLTIFIFVINCFVTYLFFKGFRINISLFGLLSFLSIPCLVVLIPVTPGHWGTWDLVSVSVLRIFNVGKEVALGCVFTMHFIMMLHISLYGVIAFLKNNDILFFLKTMQKNKIKIK
ncbi:MAG: lysylphosphatidylglycerol synthase transmembrane domain-containing protein [candidate division WOR-3 bacterium]